MNICKSFFALAVIATLAFANASAQSASSTESRPAVPIFEISADDSGKVLTIDPIAVLAGKKLTSAPDSCAESQDLQRFENKYLYVGARYSLIFGGRLAGTVKVTGLNGPEWQVNVDSSIKLKNLTMALAVAGLTPPNAASKRKNPTAAEMETARKMAAEVFREHQVPAASVTKLSISQTWVLDLHDRPQLFVAAEIARRDGDGIDYSLSFLGDPVGRVSFIFWFQHPPTETEGQAVYLIDQLDINGDGIDELFLRRVYYENYRYEIYRQEGKAWDQVFATQILGCE